MKVTRKDRRERTPSDVPAKDIPVGTVFDGGAGLCGNGPFLRTYDGIVSLDNPEMTWGPEGIYFVTAPGLLVVKDYQPLDAELVIHGPALPTTSAR